MAAEFTLLWKGESIKGATDQAVMDGINTTLFEAVAHAMDKVPRKTGQLANSITMEDAKRVSGGIAGRFGSFSVNYAIYVELGTRFMSARPYLRPAADAEFPNLVSNIKALS